MQNLLDELKQALEKDENLMAEGYKNLFYTNYTDMDDAVHAVSDENKKVNHAFYGLKK